MENADKPVSPPFVHPTAEVADTACVGAGTRVWHQGQVMPDAVIGENCNIGKGVYIDAGVSIGSGVKIQNYVSVYRGVTVEDNCFLGPCMVFTNDMYPRANNHTFTVVDTLVAEGASIGANATILCGNTIGRYAMVGAGSVVLSDVEPHTLTVGNPARAIGYVCVCGARLAVAYPVDKRTAVVCRSCSASVELNPGGEGPG